MWEHILNLLPHSSILPCRRCWGCSVLPEGKANGAHPQGRKALWFSTMFFHCGEFRLQKNRKHKPAEGREGNASRMAARQQRWASFLAGSPSWRGQFGRVALPEGSPARRGCCGTRGWALPTCVTAPCPLMSGFSLWITCLEGEERTGTRPGLGKFFPACSCPAQ